jgi:hypothetical protein
LLLKPVVAAALKNAAEAALHAPPDTRGTRAISRTAMPAD